MRTPGLFQFGHRPPVSPGQLRLTRLNIYSGLYLEWARTRVLVDPAKVPLQAVAGLEPDLILASHESMDHFDPRLCARLLDDPRRRLIGSWAVVLAFADHLPSSDGRWRQILPAIAGQRYAFGDLAVDVHASIHCEYAAPVFFEITDTTSGFRLVDAIDSAITPEMQNGSIGRRPDLLIAPAGIALGVSPDTAWEMTRILEPIAVMSGHLTRERAAFLAQAAERPSATRHVYAPDWHESVVIESGDPDPGAATSAPVRAVPDGPASVHAPVERDSDLAQLLATIEKSPDRNVQAHAMYALSCALARGHWSPEVKRALGAVGDRVVGEGREPSIAAWLLVWGLCLRASPDATASDLDRVAHLLRPDRPYLGYWVLECWGRASGSPRLADAARSRLAAVAADESLWNSVGLRRKLMWEVERLVRSGTIWEHVPALLTQALADPNPDVRLLAYRILPLVEIEPAQRRTLLRAGLTDPHEDVLEEALAAHIALFHTLTNEERNTAWEHRSLLQHGPTFHVRERANVLAEMLRPSIEAASEPCPAAEVGVET